MWLYFHTRSKREEIIFFRRGTTKHPSKELEADRSWKQTFKKRQNDERDLTFSWRPGPKFRKASLLQALHEWPVQDHNRHVDFYSAHALFYRQYLRRQKLRIYTIPRFLFPLYNLISYFQYSIYREHHAKSLVCTLRSRVILGARRRLQIKQNSDFAGRISIFQTTLSR